MYTKFVDQQKANANQTEEEIVAESRHFIPNSLINRKPMKIRQKRRNVATPKDRKKEH